MAETLYKIPNVIAFVLAFLTLVGLVIAADRFLYLRRAKVDTFELLRGLLNQLRSGRVKEAIANCDSKTGPVGEIFRNAIEHWNDGEAAIRHVVEETGMLLVPRLERNLKLLASFANMLPIIGLIGTLASISSIFEKFGGGTAPGFDKLSGDVRIALLCTAAGLLASLICQLCHAVLVEKVDYLLEEMGKAAAEITFFLTHNPPPTEETGTESEK